jgi:hypothetical protein
VHDFDFSCCERPTLIAGRNNNTSCFKTNLGSPGRDGAQGLFTRFLHVFFKITKYIGISRLLSFQSAVSSVSNLKRRFFICLILQEEQTTNTSKGTTRTKPNKIPKQRAITFEFPQQHPGVYSLVVCATQLL